MGYSVAVVGATGNVGREMLQTLADREFPADEVVALASERSIGGEISFGEAATLKVKNLAEFDFRGIDIVLASPGAKVSAVFAPKAAAAGAIVIDNTSHFRMDPDVPLVLRSIHTPSPTIASAASSPTRTARRFRWSWRSNPARSGKDQAGGGGDLPVGFRRRQGRHGRAVQPDARHLRQRAGVEASEEIHQADCLQRHPAHRFVHGRRIDEEEWKMAVETRKILDPDIQVSATCVRVPVFIGHAEAVNVEFEGPITEKEAWAALREAPGVSVIDYRADEGYVTPQECVRTRFMSAGCARTRPCRTDSASGALPTTSARERR